MKELRIHAIPLADDDGDRKYTFTLDNLSKGIARAVLRNLDQGLRT